jgi:hypothetical protein
MMEAEAASDEEATTHSFPHLLKLPTLVLNAEIGHPQFSLFLSF